MLTSQLLLLIFVAYWLRTEYFKEKTQLQKELTVELIDANRSVTDSIILEKFVAPSLFIKGNNKIKASYKYGSKSGGKEGNKAIISIYTENNISGKNQIKLTEDKKNLINKQLELIDRGKGLIIDSLGRIADTFIKIAPIGKNDIKELSKQFSNTINNEDSTSQDIPVEMFKTIYKVVYEKILKDSSFAGAELSKLNDSLRVMYTFENVMNEKDWNFEVEWIEGAPTEGKHPAFLVVLDDDQTMKIKNYKAFLYKKILPQTGFSLLLLALTGIAFLFTYRSLNRQIKLSELKNGLISNMSHELKTPVSTVKIALEALDNFDVVNQPEKAREYIHMAMLETHRLELLVNKALNNSMMEQGKMTLQRQQQSVLELVENIVAALQLRMQQKNSSITLTSIGENFQTNIDKLHVQGAVMNIIDNSIKYGNSPTEIEIKVIAKDASINIEISDNGPGIPQQYINQVFDKFFRVPEGDQHNVKGYGLGLSYVHQVMQMHSGIVQVHNKQHSGCTFSLQFYRGR